MARAQLGFKIRIFKVAVRVFAVDMYNFEMSSLITCRLNCTQKIKALMLLNCAGVLDFSCSWFLKNYFCPNVCILCVCPQEGIHMIDTC